MKNVIWQVITQAVTDDSSHSVCADGIQQLQLRFGIAFVSEDCKQCRKIVLRYKDSD